MHQIFELQTEGFVVTSPLLSPVNRAALIRQVALPTHRAGTRSLLRYPWCAALAQRLSRHPMLAPLLPSSPVAVQCTFFKKSLEKNWLVPWHQDLIVPVPEHINHPAFTVWSEKEGQHFAQAPAQFLAKLLAVRLYLDTTTAANGALRVIPGSHRHGRLNEADLRTLHHTNGATLCAVPAGAVMAMRPLLLHASSKTSSPQPRRVLHFLYAPKNSLQPYNLQ